MGTSCKGLLTSRIIVSEYKKGNVLIRRDKRIVYYRAGRPIYDRVIDSFIPKEKSTFKILKRG